MQEELERMQAILEVITQVMQGYTYKYVGA
jgi:hypothetical protein